MTEPVNNTDRFYRLVWPVRSTVLRAAILLTHNTGKAEEITHETLVKAWRSLHQFDGPEGHLLAWLMAILRHTWVDQIRSNAAHNQFKTSLDQLCESGNEPVDVDCAADDMDIRDADAMLDGFSDQVMIDALKALPEDMRWTLLLVDVTELSYEFASQVLDVAVGTVRSRVSRARAMLRRHLLTCPDFISDKSK